MANKRRHETPSSSNTPLIILAAAGVLVAALVIWALTRTVEPPTAALPEPVASTQAAEGTAPLTTTATTGSLPPATPPAEAPFAGEDPASVPRIAAEDLRAKHNRNEVLVVDVRDPRAFATAHIPGSINVAFASVDGAAGSLPKDRPIVTYCT